MEDMYSETVSEIDWEMFDFENEIEPIARARSNTWPVPQPENYFDAHILTDDSSKVGSTEHITTSRSTQADTSRKATDGTSRRKKSSRKNPWGDLSYAELITQAINSSEDRRLTLSQIYDWMVQNVPFFRDKSESKSSAGWKNSVRHNLSLHNRFLRVPNEAQGKSSWWTINPNATLSKTTRRRAASMEAGKLEKKRALAAKRADSLRKRLLKNESVIASSDSGDSVAQPALVNKYLQGRIRPRTASCASSLGKFTVISQIPEEQIWMPCEYQEPVTQPPMQPINQSPMQHMNQSPMQHMNQPPMQPTSHVYVNQGYQQPPGDQIFVAPQNFTEVTAICLTHPVGGCNCSNLVVVNNEIPCGSSSGEENDFENVRASAICNLLQNVLTHNVDIIDPALLQNKEENDVGYNNFAYAEQTNQAADNRVLPRNNSMLDDINEIIKKEQIVEMERVNNSLSTTLFISNNNNLIHQL